ncbi:MAG: hypothetical protein H0T62_10255 [Parachlamydiaceae bacterium]|nr:hypothetical protein [Parachlamydiaceae bacterium]
MNCLDSLKALYEPDVRFGDSLIKPMRITMFGWEHSYGPQSPFQGWEGVAYRISAFIPLVILTLGAVILCAIGMVLKMCSSLEYASDRIKYFSLLDDLPTELYLPEPERKTSSESVQLFSTFNADCINQVLTFLSFRDKLKLLQTTKYFQKVVEESPSWDLYFKGCDNLITREKAVLPLDYFKSNIQQGRLVFTPAYETFYTPITQKINSSAIRNLPVAFIETSETPKMINTLFGSWAFESILTGRIQILILTHFAEQSCFRVMFNSPDGGMGECIIFHEGDNMDARYIFFNYWDLNTGSIKSSYWVGEIYKGRPYEKELLELLANQFELYFKGMDVI